LFEIEAMAMEEVRTGGHRCEYRSALDDEPSKFSLTWTTHRWPTLWSRRILIT
jgi:hypothetical protein